MPALLSIAISAAHNAGDEIMRLYETTAFETKPDGSPVTVADTRSNEILLSSLIKTDIPILSEESKEKITPPYPSRMWIIDPLDGTRNFIEKNGDFSVMIGLLEHGRPALGVVYAPAHETLYYAVRDQGAFAVTKGVERKLNVSSREADLRCIRSVHHFSPRMKIVAEKLNATLHPHGSVGIRAGLIGEDAGDLFFSWGKFGEWDVCAPEIIVREAGGRVSDVYGAELSYGSTDHRLKNGVVFSNSACHTQVINALESTPA
jgi:3'(2'), 5'-bisphosphate nucleotidase